MGDIVARAKNILFTPKTEWDVIEQESATTKELYTGYICVLAAIPAIAGFIGSTVFGYEVLGLKVRTGVSEGVGQAIVGYALALLSVYVLAIIVDKLAPNFGGQSNQIQALKLATYASTAGWVAGVFQAIPGLRMLVIVGSLYGIYLLYIGLPKLMKNPDDKTAVYTAVVIIATIVIVAIAGAIAGMLT
jgi:hypothetical protein